MKNSVKARRGKICALTFDDGPSEWTAPILGALAEYGAHATFFVLGVNMDRARVVRQMVEQGHELGVHGWDHTPVDGLDQQQITKALADTLERISLSGAAAVRWWRPPWHRVTPDAALAAEQLGLSYCGVTVDGLDVNRNDDQIVKTVYGSLQDLSIVGLHDGVASNGNHEIPHRKNTVRAVERILVTLAKEYRFVTVSELLEYQ